MEVCAVIRRDDCPDHQASTIVIVNYSDIGRVIDVAMRSFIPLRAICLSHAGSVEGGDNPSRWLIH
ncbi:hypothetical protein TNCV_4996321 [Trichonephila clavipes]|nr:hypothetical protein TNCV_4996321 [Trichonephila clavipes]